MSTFTAIGPALNIDGPLPRPPKYRLLALPGVAREGEGRWQNGVNVWGYPVDTPFLWEPCASRDGTFRTKTDESEMPIVRFDPLAAYLPLTCSTISVGDAAEFSQRATRALEASISGAVEQALVNGVVGSTNPYFGDTNMINITIGGGTVTPEVGLMSLEAAIGYSGRGGMIHCTPGVAAAWTVGNMIMDMDQDGFQETTGNYTPIAVGQGYTGAEPVGETASNPQAGIEWAFATGPVEVFLAPMTLLPGEESEALERATNVVTYRAEQYFLPYWDTALQVGVLIDWTTCCGQTPPVQ